MTQQFHIGVFYPKKSITLIQTDIRNPMSIAALFTTANVWKQPRCPSVGKWVKKMQGIRKMEYYSAIKKNEILPLVTTWIYLEGITLCEIRQRMINTL